MDLKPGERIGEYEIVALLGRGGMAVVYNAYQSSLDRNVAFKVLPQQYAFDNEFVTRFLHEARIAANLQHPHIVKIYQVSENPPYYIAMELIEGVTLHDLLFKQGPLRPDHAATILLQIAGALGYAHQNGVIHRDLKTSNIMLNQRGNAILLDFGIARAMHATRLTKTGISMGTPEYMAPEVTQGAAATPSADIYAMGVVAFEMLAGKAPFRGETTQAILFQHAFNPMPSLHQFGIQISPSLENVLRKALAKTPAHRYTEVMAFARDFERAARGEAVAVALPVEQGGIITPVPRANRTPLIIAGVAIAAAFLILALLFLPLLFAPPSSPVLPPTEIANASTPPSVFTATPPTVPVSNSPVPPTSVGVAAQIIVTPTALPTIEPPTPDPSAAAAAVETRLAELVAATINAQATQLAEISAATFAAQQTQTASVPTSTRTPTRRPPTRVPPTSTPTPAPPTATRAFFGVRLVSPENRAVFNSEFESPLLEWKTAVSGNLAPNEWYRVQVGHGGPPVCNLYTKELFYQLPPSGQSGEGCNPETWRFNTGDYVWRVSFVIRVDGDVNHDTEIGNSEGRLFKWNRP